MFNPLPIYVSVEGVDRGIHLIQVSVTVYLSVVYIVTPEDLTKKVSYHQEAKFSVPLKEKTLGGFIILF